MVFKIPAAAGHLKKNRFEFQLPNDDAVYSLPKLEFCPSDGEDYIKESSGKSQTNRDFVFGLVDVLDPELGTKLRASGLARDQVSAFYESWLKAGRIKDPGESSGSESS